MAIEMGSTISVIKTLMIPATISLILFVVSSYVIIPLWQRHRGRYSQYLPLDRISDRTSSIRARIQSGLSNMFVPSILHQSIQDRLVVATSRNSDPGYDSEDGEELATVQDTRRRADLEQGDWEGPDETRRLSRELEEGFMDDSDEEDRQASSRR